jgi:hypothetical protein
MDGEIKKESSPMTQQNFDGLLEYKPIIKEKPDIIDERASLDEYNDVLKRANKLRQDTLNNRPDYPWEKPEAEYVSAKGTANPVPYQKKIFYVDGFFSRNNTTQTVSQFGSVRTISVGRGVTKLIAKYKGNPSSRVTIAGDGTVPVGTFKPLNPAPPADPSRRAADIAEVKRDPGYKNWAKQINKNGGDRWLEALYNETVQIKAVFFHMMFMIALESRFWHQNVNKDSNAQGLIQWMPDKFAVFRKRGFQSPIYADQWQQLPFITLYYQGRPNWKKVGSPNLISTYSYVIGGNTTDPNYRLYSSPSKKYRKNSGLDINKDGTITTGEAALTTVNRWYDTTKWQTKYPNGIWKKGIY